METPNHAERAHYINGGSSIKRRMLCPGSAEIEKQMPSTTSEAAEKGTFIHEGIELAIPQAVKAGKVEFILPPNYTPDDIDLVELAVENIFEIIGDKWKSIGWACESKFVLDHDLELGGTADFVYAYKQADGKRVGGIWDYKNGTVETDIIQCILYMCAMDSQLGGFDILRGHIFQPNGLDESKHSKFVEITKEEAESYKEIFIKAAKTSLGFMGREAMVLVPGEEQCRFCNGTARCPAVREKSKELIESVILQNQTTLPDPNDIPKLLTDEQVLKWLTNSEYIKQVDKAIWTHASDRFNQGNPIEGTKAVYGRSTSTWDTAAPQEKIVEALQMIGVQDPYEKKLIGITKVDAIRKKNKFPKKQMDALLAPFRVNSVPGISIVLDNEANAGKIEASAPSSKVLDLVTEMTLEQEKKKEENG